ncbi:unnamed protein product [Phyllotreta striolata]|uniref:Polyprenal reductase n=1 Tax=Phyllotreta striolata TaxID=444603 RepID=A0A9N9TI87_PHYSR|nr:unnamed protein product [Phyllotreta striolata]
MAFYFFNDEKMSISSKAIELIGDMIDRHRGSFNLVKFYFIGNTAAVFMGALLMSFWGESLPHIGRLIRYGRTGRGTRDIWGFNIPKSRFRHFYIVATIVFTVILCHVTCFYVFGFKVPSFYMDFIESITHPNRKVHVSATHAYVAILLLTLQVFRRFYDTHYVSVFGLKSRMNIFHYIVGMTYYIFLPFAVISEAPKFVKNETKPSSGDIDFSVLTGWDYVAIVVFLWAWWHQYVSFKILAALRKNRQGEVVTNAYDLPCGDWFEYLSCPPQVAEILMYSCLTILLLHNVTWRYAYLWVCTNQMITIIFSHQWYKSRFQRYYPEERKLLIPFIY